MGTKNPLSRERTERQGATPSGSGAPGTAGTTPYKGGRYSAAQAAALIRKVGGTPEEAAALGAVAMPESQGDPRAHNPNRNTGDDSWGLWQINMLDKLAADRYKRFGKFGLTKPSDLENPELNAKIALQMYRDKIAAGRPGLEDWSTWKSGKDVAYRQQASAGAYGNVELPQAAGATPAVPGTAGTSQYTAEVQKNRPQVRQGTITFEGNGSKFSYGSGSPSDPNYPSIPSGSSKLTGLNPHNVPGGVGIDMPALQGYDPKVNRSRDGMVIHMGRSNDPTELYSHGCIAIPPNQFNAFNKQLDEFKRSHGGEAYINVFPDGNITVTAAPQMSGEIVTATEAVQKQRQALEEGKKVPYQTPIGEELQQQSQAHQSGSLGAGGTGKVNVDQLTNQQLKNAGVETPSLTISQKPAEQKTQS
ncbi:hypothetical protein EB001_18245, partial [bacterium]|nr:hypothetical protein [bacterium]